MFSDREDAGRRLARALLSYKDKGAVVLALPRGGVPVAYEVARVLDAPLDLVLVRKIGAPWQPELAVGAVCDGPAMVTVFNEDILRALDLKPDDLGAEIDAEMRRNAERRRLWLAGRPPLSVAGRIAILVDDGVATGATTRAALRAVRAAGPAELVLAVPVAPPESIDALAAEADRVVCLETPSPFGAISVFYRAFPQLTDEAVSDLLDRARFGDRPPPQET
jgi:predicted phosphoribosyltransferase